MTPTAGALFAGYGGLDLALAAVFGAHVAWVSEVDPAPARILAHHWPHAPNLGDVTKVDWAATPAVDLLSGGSPCQDLSQAGNRAGMRAGTRSGLWASMRDAIKTLRPSLVVWENVRGAFTACASSDLEPCPRCVGGPGKHRPVLRALGRVLGDLADLGYDAAWVGLRAADVGAPHGRFRVFVLAWPQDARLDDDPPWLTAAGGDPLGLTPAPGPLLPTPAVNDMGRGKSVEAWDEWTARMRDRHGNGNGHGPSLEIEALRLLPTPEAKLGSSGPDYARADRPGSGGDSLHEAVGRLLPTPTTRDTKGHNQRRDDTCLTGALLPTPTGGDARSSGATYAATDTHNPGTTLTDATVRQPEAFGQYAAAVERWEGLTRPAPSPTAPDGRDGAARLSPGFVEWMMGLPDGWVTAPAIWDGVKPSTARSAQLTALGNGVVPQQASAALRHLLTIRARALAGDLP